MIIFKCILSGDEMFADTFKYKETDDKVFYMVYGSIVTRNEQFDDSLIAANASAEEAVESNDSAVSSGVDIVLNHKLKETSFRKADYVAYLKSYVKAIRAKLLEESPEKAQDFEARVKVGVGNIMKDFKDYQFFTGENMDVEGMVGLLNYNDDDKPYMLFFKDGLLAEKV
ncbi:translationally-controlled tumor protein homolog [Mugil cephalus]|uniref:translationally-controlled tumor protein homolog n=1 Tax=Mugil cephalus TaxID=48193 RepID=UPI001FB7ABFF|nr:translationally-controlled tumor protein homolog [Mugil cephalus]